MFNDHPTTLTATHEFRCSPFLVFHRKLTRWQVAGEDFPEMRLEETVSLRTHVHKGAKGLHRFHLREGSTPGMAGAFRQARLASKARTAQHASPPNSSPATRLASLGPRTAYFWLAEEITEFSPLLRSRCLAFVNTNEVGIMAKYVFGYGFKLRQQLKTCSDATRRSHDGRPNSLRVEQEYGWRTANSKET